MAEVRMVIAGEKLNELLNGPAGVIWPHMMRRATIFRAAVRRQQPRRTGCLQDRTVMRVEAGGDLGGFALRFLCDTRQCSADRKPYSLYVHEGTKPHPIVAVNAPMLAFFWPNGPNGPGMYFFPSVNHPGTKANRFFTDNLHIFTDQLIAI